MNAAVVITVTGHQEDNKPYMYALPWALTGKWNGEVHRRDKLQNKLKDKVILRRHITVLVY